MSVCNFQYFLQTSSHDKFSFNAIVSVVVPYSSVPQIYNVLYPINLQYLAKTSADNTLPIKLPKCGTLLHYGNADVIRIFLLLSFGKTILFLLDLINFGPTLF